MKWTSSRKPTEASEQSSGTLLSHSWTNGKPERPAQTAKCAVKGLLHRKICHFIEKLEDDLDAWIVYYNSEGRTTEVTTAPVRR